MVKRPHEDDIAFLLLAFWLMEYKKFGFTIAMLTTMFNTLQTPYGNLNRSEASEALWWHVMLSFKNMLTTYTFDSAAPWAWQSPLVMSTFVDTLRNKNALQQVCDAVLLSSKRMLSRTNHIR